MYTTARLAAAEGPLEEGVAYLAAVSSIQAADAEGAGGAGDGDGGGEGEQEEDGAGEAGGGEVEGNDGEDSGVQ